MNPARKQRLFWVLFFFGGAATMLALVIFALGQNINLYFTPSQLSKAPANRDIKLGGMVVKRSVIHDPHSLHVEFVLTDLLSQEKVIYNGVLPDLFREGQGIVAIGKLSPRGDFIASQVLAKHDENYMPPNLPASLKRAQT